MKKKCVLIIILISVITIIIGIALYSNNIEKLKLFQNKKSAINEKNTSSTTIDITYLEDNGNLAHEHIFKTMYDENKHWEECTVCGQKENEMVHSYKSSWTLGTPNDCNPNNVLKKVCTCGYSQESTQGRKAHSLAYQHNNGNCTGYLQCTNCWSGASVTNLHDCYKSDGTRITCLNLGKCRTCNFTYTANYVIHYSRYYYGRENENKNLNCMTCNTYVAQVSKYELVKESENIYKFYADIIVPNNAQYNTTYAQSYWGDNVTIQNSVSRNGTTWSNIATIKFSGHNETTSYGVIIDQYYINGRKYNVVIATNFNIDNQPPLINSISMGTNEELIQWSKTKPIIVSGTENYCNTVTVKILDENGNTIFDGKGNVNNENYSVTCIPQIECDTIGKNFTAIVTDNLRNRSEKEFTISKVDAIPPTPTSETEILGDWAKSKDFTFTATDYGIGQVSIAFNDIEDLKLANVDDNTYSRDYTFTGDVYIPKQLSVMYKDGLGNTSMQKITIDKLDNTEPTITKAELHNNKLTITANDEHKILGEGSGVVKYRYIASEEKITNPELTDENSTESTNAEITIEDIYKIKYIYIVAEDYVENVSEVYEFEVPPLVLTSTVNLNTADGKGEIILDWSTYEVSDKYFVVYRKQDNQTEWETIVPLTQKLTGSTYTDKLGNDTTKPNVPTINITGDVESNNIKITAENIDNGTQYTYYIEAYDSIGTLISKSN